MDMDDLLIKYLLGEATPDETARIERWLSEDSGNRQRYEQFREVWKISGRTGLPVTPDPQAALQRFRQRIGQQPSIGQKPSIGQQPRILTSDHRSHPVFSSLAKWRVAAILAGILCLGAGTWFILRRPHDISLAADRGASLPSAPSVPGSSKALPSPAVSSPTDPSTALHSRAGVSHDDQGGKTAGWQRDRADSTARIAVLPDGSVVTLNKHADIVYASDGRTILLHGEAFFSAAPNPAKPFVVQASDLAVTVLGTSFNIRSVAGRTEVIVETGAVRVNRSGENLILHPGEKATAEAGTKKLKKTGNTDPLYTWYLNRPLVCDSVPLSRIVEMLNEAYDAHIVIGRETLNDLRLTTVFRHQPLDAMLAVIAATADCAIVREGPTIILK